MSEATIWQCNRCGIEIARQRRDEVKSEGYGPNNSLHFWRQGQSERSIGKPMHFCPPCLEAFDAFMRNEREKVSPSSFARNVELQNELGQLQTRALELEGRALAAEERLQRLQRVADLACDVLGANVIACASTRFSEPSAHHRFAEDATKVIKVLRVLTLAELERLDAGATWLETLRRAAEERACGPAARIRAAADRARRAAGEPAADADPAEPDATESSSQLDTSAAMSKCAVSSENDSQSDARPKCYHRSADEAARCPVCRPSPEAQGDRSRFVGVGDADDDPSPTPAADTSSGARAYELGLLQGRSWAVARLRAYSARNAANGAPDAAHALKWAAHQLEAESGELLSVWEEIHSGSEDPPRIDENAAALERDCPALGCGALPGKPCHDAGEPRAEPHPVRWIGVDDALTVRRST